MRHVVAPFFGSATYHVEQRHPERPEPTVLCVALLDVAEPDHELKGEGGHAEGRESTEGIARHGIAQYEVGAPGIHTGHPAARHPAASQPRERSRRRTADMTGAKHGNAQGAVAMWHCGWPWVAVAVADS